MQKSDCIIGVEHVSKFFGDKAVLNDVNLSVRKGEFVTILGPSGCGKTTLLRLIAGFQTASEGVITIAGKDITQTPPHKRPVNTVFQKYALFPHLNVFNNIAFGLKLKKLPGATIEKKVKQALRMVGMTDYEDRDVDSLSGGQQQRVAIARAIVNEPEVLLLDEPLAALDLKMRKDMQMELKEMHQKLGITFVYVTHDQEEALTLSDTIVVMSEGRIQQIGVPTDIYNEPINSFVADFIGESNILNGVMIKDKAVTFCGHEFECVDTGFGEQMQVDVVIRPEDIYIFDVSDAAQLTGTVTSCIFKGVHYEMLVQTREGYELMVQDYHAFEAGREVGLLVKPFDIHVMKKERTCNTFELKQHITDAAVTYLRIVSTGLPFIFLSAAFTGIYNAAGRSKIPFYISGTGLIMNIVLDPLFIFGFGWGTVGAALATWLSEATVFGIFVYKLRGKSAVLGGFSFIVPLKKKYTRRIFKLGLPVATLNTLFAFVNMFLSRTASERGGHIGLMAFTTGGQIEAITWNTSQGFSTGLSTFIAQNYAAGQKSRVKQAWRTTMWMTGVFGSLCSLLFIFFGSEVFSIFVPEAEAYRVGGDFLRIDGYSQMFMMMEITMQGVFYGLGRTVPPAIVSIGCNYMRIPVALLLVHMGMGVDAIWWAVSGTTVAKGLILTAWFVLIKRKIL